MSNPRTWWPLFAHETRAVSTIPLRSTGLMPLFVPVEVMTMRLLGGGRQRGEGQSEVQNEGGGWRG